MTINELLEKELKRRLSDEQKITDATSIVKPKKFIVEKYYAGFRTLVHKQNDELKIYSDAGKDITQLFSKAFESLLALSGQDFIIDCEVLTKDKDACFYVSDLLYLNKDLTDEPLNRRKQFMKKLSYSDNIKENPIVVVDSTTDVKKALKLFMQLKDSKGVIIKDYYGKYLSNTNTNDWVLLSG